MLWVASAWQLGDGLTKAGLAKKMREILTEGKTKFHEESARALGRAKQDLMAKERREKKQRAKMLQTLNEDANEDDDSEDS